MRTFERACLHDFLDERIIFRDLNPLDSNLARLDDIRTKLHLPDDMVPRKTSPEYARVIAYLLEMASHNDGKKNAIETIIYIGDTCMNDGKAFHNICSAGNWRGIAMITSEENELTKLGLEKEYHSLLFTNNHWVNLRVLKALAQMKGIEIDERSAILIDVDKTALGARGRNDTVIDNVRIAAAQRTLNDILHGSFSPKEFQRIYRVLNQPLFHPFTADNQDFLVYICMIVMCKLFKLDDLQTAAQLHMLSDFHGFLQQVDQRKNELPAEARSVHKQVLELVQIGDSTPFKQFRQAEYFNTVQHMGQLPDDAPIETMLQEEIVITREVMEFALESRSAGALVFGLSDKPVEASVPRQPAGLLPLHQVQTHVIGE
ncbi:MAG TPA: hypothetical protein DCK95_12630 [Anaerolineaceae bacterium]|nr:hypothetical protein [Anaerolineaceae bacterium]